MPEFEESPNTNSQVQYTPSQSTRNEGNLTAPRSNMRSRWKQSATSQTKPAASEPSTIGEIPSTPAENPSCEAQSEPAVAAEASHSERPSRRPSQEGRPQSGRNEGPREATRSPRPSRDFGPRAPRETREPAAHNRTERTEAPSAPRFTPKPAPKKSLATKIKLFLLKLIGIKPKSTIVPPARFRKPYPEGGRPQSGGYRPRRHSNNRSFRK